MCQEEWAKIGQSNQQRQNRNDRKSGGVNITTKTIQKPVRGYERLEVVLKVGTEILIKYFLVTFRKSCKVLNRDQFSFSLHSFIFLHFVLKLCKFALSFWLNFFLQTLHSSKIQQHLLHEWAIWTQKLSSWTHNCHSGVRRQNCCII